MNDVIVADSEVTWLVEFSPSVLIDDIVKIDKNIAFYVSVPYTLNVASLVDKNVHVM